jgi:splicing factor 3B subunit 3
VWSGSQGARSALSFRSASREDGDFFQALEGQIRSEDPPLAGCDHLVYRGYYASVKGVIDGDLCERYLLFPNDNQTNNNGGARSIGEGNRAEIFRKSLHS